MIEYSTTPVEKRRVVEYLQASQNHIIIKWMCVNDLKKGGGVTNEVAYSSAKQVNNKYYYNRSYPLSSDFR